MLPAKSWLHIGLLIFPVAAIYMGSISSYFVADDFWQVHSCSRIMDGEIALLWHNFTGNFVQLPGAEFYRPVLGLSYLLDFAIWKTNPIGYHLTNILLYSANVILIYLVVLKILPESYAKSAPITALLSALLFATTPLHTEAVAWISGRADILSGFYYLLSLYLFLLGGKVLKSPYFIASVLCFVLALGSKETAIGLPVVIFSACLFATPEKAENQSAEKSDFTSQLKQSTIAFIPFLVVALAYLGVRYLCFDTILGGYIGGFGSAKSQFALVKWFDPSIWQQVFLPFNVALASHHGVLFLVMATSVLLSIMLILPRLFLARLPFKTITLIVLWMISTLVPLFGVWGVDQYLHNSRLVFFFSMPLAILLPVILLRSPDQNAKNYMQIFQKIVNTGSMFCLITCVIAYFLLSLETDKLWQQAAEITKSIKTESVAVAKNLSKEEKAIILGIPGDYKGAFIILNGSTYHHMMSKPLSPENYSKKLVTFKPYIFGHENYINARRLKSLINEDATISGVYLYDAKSNKLKKLELTKSTNNTAPLKMPFVLGIKKQESKVSIIGKHKFLENNTIVLKDSARRPKLKMDKLTLNPLDFDYLKFKVKTKRNKRFRNPLTPVMVTWNKGKANRIVGAVPSNLDNLQTSMIGLSQYWRWYQSGTVSYMQLVFGRADEVFISDLSLMNSKTVQPELTIQKLKPLNSGEHVVTSDEIEIAWQADSIDKAYSVVLEISKPNFFFDGPTLKSSILNVRTYSSLEGSATVSTDFFEEGSYTQMRMIAVDINGMPISQYSDPVTIFKNKSELKNSYVF